MIRFMLKFKILLLAIILIFALVFVKDKADKISGSQNKAFLRDEKGLLVEVEKGVGEKMTYDVRLAGISLGSSVFTHAPGVEINGRKVSVMIFETSLARFKDIETIYSDPETMLPVRVERDVLKWLIREKITENYDQKGFTVTIEKQEGGGKPKATTIKKTSPIHNAILLPQYIRHSASLPAAGQAIIANLPNRQYEIKLVSTEEIKVPAGVFKAYHFKSTPNHIDVWISADERKIPLKIQSNSLALGYTLVLKEYRAG